VVASAVILRGRTICQSQAVLHTTQPRASSAGDGTNACIPRSTNPTASGFGVPVVDQGDAAELAALPAAAGHRDQRVYLLIFRIVTRAELDAPVIDICGAVEQIALRLQQLPDVASSRLHQVVFHRQQAEGVGAPGPVLEYGVLLQMGTRPSTAL